RMSLQDLAKATYLTACRLLLHPTLYYEWKHPRITRHNERPVEFAFAFRCLARYFPADLLDVGPGKTAWPHLLSSCGFRVTAVDKIEGYWRGTFFNRHFYVKNEDITRPNPGEAYDFITCISVLEHIEDHEAAFSGLCQRLRPGGHLVLTCPYNDRTFIGNAYSLPGSNVKTPPGYICRIYSRCELERWLSRCAVSIVDQEYYQVFTGPYWTTGEWSLPVRRVDRSERHHLTCLLFEKPV
ncbi:MAG: methyltransferase domain-containing protein, partial [Acidobacteriota bacterium]